jgi:hypothetical protein
LAKRLTEDQLRRMTAMFVDDKHGHEYIAQAVGIAGSSVSRYHRAFKGKVPMPVYVGRELRKYDLIKSYTPYVRAEAKTVEYERERTPALGHSHNAELGETPPTAFVDAQPELPGTPEISPYYDTYVALKIQRDKLDTAIAAVEELL